MEISHKILDAGVFKRILIEVSDRGKPINIGISAVVTSPSKREEIFLPSPDKLQQNVTYPHTGGRFVTCTGIGKFQIIFQPKEKGKHELKLLGNSGKPFQKLIVLDF